jgi:hypothetical protein
MAVTSRRPTRRARRLALLLALASLLAPLALAASGDPCCAGMAAPCDEDPSPCATLDVAPCCDVAPATAWPTAERECAQSLLAPAARATASVAVQPALPMAPATSPVRLGSPPRLSVVLRN